MRLGIFLGLEGRAKVCPLFELRGVVLHYVVSAKHWSSNWSILHLLPPQVLGLVDQTTDF